jgi:hypothetical protein
MAARPACPCTPARTRALYAELAKELGVASLPLDANGGVQLGMLDALATEAVPIRVEIEGDV